MTSISLKSRFSSIIKVKQLEVYPIINISFIWKLPVTCIDNFISVIKSFEAGNSMTKSLFTTFMIHGVFVWPVFMLVYLAEWIWFWQLQYTVVRGMQKYVWPFDPCNLFYSQSLQKVYSCLVLSLFCFKASSFIIVDLRQN